MTQVYFLNTMLICISLSNIILKPLHSILTNSKQSARNNPEGCRTTTRTAVRENENGV